MLQIQVKNSESGQTLEKFIKKVLKDAPLSYIYKLFRKKEIKVNGKREDMKYVVNEDDDIIIYIPDEKLTEFKKKVTVVRKDTISSFIVYEDDNILLINKPRGILVQKDEESNKKTLDQMVIEYLSYKNEYDPNDSLAFTPGPAHRLDRNTSGIIAFGKNNASLQCLFKLLKNHENIGKHYVALVKGVIEKDGYVDLPLKKNENNNKVTVCSVKNGGKTAKTIYHVIENYHDFSLLDLTLVTGRTHQIRVHLASIGHPIVGDAKYGDFELNKSFENTFGLKNQFLHASTLSFGDVEYPLSYLKSKSFNASLPSELQLILNKIKEY